eukprot:1088809-Lingulodinium_polyedra.AAC.1
MFRLDSAQDARLCSRATRCIVSTVDRVRSIDSWDRWSKRMQYRFVLDVFRHFDILDADTHA